MLVITRRPQDRILFPKLGITVHVVRVDGRSVRLGIEAPRAVHVIRHELAAEGRYEPQEESTATSGWSHEQRNQLQMAVLSLHLLQRNLELGRINAGQIEEQVGAMLKMLQSLESGLSPEQPVLPLPREGRDAARRTALIVEDNANERALLAGFLATCNYDVATADDGADALNYLAKNARPDVVLLDMNMPRLNGAATIREIRSNPDLMGVKVIAVSGQAQRQSKVPLGPQGVDHWFMKPIRPDRLVEEIDRELAAPAI